MKKNIGIAGGGPAALFLYKRLVEANNNEISISIFEKNNHIGAGMPYSADGASVEHITNVSANEIPLLVTPLKEWLEHASPELLQKFNISLESFNEYRVLPRLLFGEYLCAQFDMLKDIADKAGIETKLYLNTLVQDIRDDADKQKVVITTGDDNNYDFDAVIICTGHRWPKILEEKVTGWFDSPYPPSKLKGNFNFPIAIKGASLTAVDAIRTIARENGVFTKQEDHTISYKLNESSEGLKLVLHSIGGLLPAIRFHLKDPHLATGPVPLSEEEIQELVTNNEGFVPLDYLFERNFKLPLQERDPDFYEKVRAMKLEEFTDYIMSFRNSINALLLFKGEYVEAEKSIKRHESVNWKEILAELSYAINYPAKHLSAEDMLRLRKTLLPLISIVIAFMPQSSARELIALHDAGVLELVPVGPDSVAEPAEDAGAWYTYKDEEGQQQKLHYRMFVNAVGQAAYMYDEFIFPGLLESGSLSAASLRFKSADEAEKEKESGNKMVFNSSPGNYYLKVSGININDHFQVLDKYGVFNDRVYIMAVPYIAGLNPDYSGLDFCENASLRIVQKLLEA